MFLLIRAFEIFSAKLAISFFSSSSSFSKKSSSSDSSKAFIALVELAPPYVDFVSSNALQKPLTGLASSSLKFWWSTNQFLTKSFVYTNSLFKCLFTSALYQQNMHEDEKLDHTRLKVLLNLAHISMERTFFSKYLWCVSQEAYQEVQKDVFMSSEEY